MSKPTDPLAVEFGPYAGEVVAVHDGDTLTVRLDCGFGASVTEQIRVYGINAPELHRGSDEERAAGASSANHLAGLVPPGTRVRVTTELARSFTRYIGSVEFISPIGSGTVADLAGAMVAAGHAVWCDADLNPLHGPPPPLRPACPHGSPCTARPARRRVASRPAGPTSRATAAR